MNSSHQFHTCLICGAGVLHPLKGYESNYLVECEGCGFVFCQRKPTTEELKAHYDLYPRANAISEITLKRYDELLDTFEPFRKTNNLIDVGCGDGYFLEAAKRRNWNVFGTEFTQEAIEVCRKKGIQMTESPLDSGHYPRDFFDVVTSFEVVEHINNPHQELAVFNSILRKHGVVYVTTPNFNSISRNILKSKWNIIEYPEHLSYYTSRTLRMLFRQHNFSCVQIKTTGISINRLKAGAVLEGPGSSTVNSDEQLRQRTEEKTIFKFLKVSINQVLNITRKGDTIKALFRKQ